MDWIINSLADVDLYKLTMLNGFFNKYPDMTSKWRYKMRSKGIRFTPPMIAELRRQIMHLGDLRFTEEEVLFVGHLRFIHPFVGFREFLRMYRLNTYYIHVDEIDEDPGFDIWAEGPEWQAGMFETFVLPIVSEIYTRYTLGDYWDGSDEFEHFAEGDRRLSEKIEMLKKHPIGLTDFGMRRRASRRWQSHVLYRLKNELPPECKLMGTSDVRMAMDFDITPQGTFAHQWVEAHQGLKNVALADSQRAAFQAWADLYRGDLGTCLTDTLGTDKFLRDFDRYFAMLFGGLRHDSGDPFEWAETMIDMYEKFGIDPKTKTLFFSDSLDIPKAIAIDEAFGKRARVLFGIGTNLMNDVGAPYVSQVMKMVEVNGLPCAKLSNDPTKEMCEDDEFSSHLRHVIAR
jgi:nicotinate phosphoribosyltransferase